MAQFSFLARRTPALLAALALCGLTLGGTSAAPDPSPGTIIDVQPSDLPPPYVTKSVNGGAKRIARAGREPRVPPGFTVNLFAEGFQDARWLTVAPNGDVLVSEPKASRITLLRDADRDGVAEQRFLFTRGFKGAHGLAIVGEWLYVADTHAIWRLPYKPGDESARGERRRVSERGALGQARGHWTRNLVFDPQTRRFLVTVGSQSNLGEEPEPHATIQEISIDGTRQRTFASGLRNPVGIARQPASGDLYVVVNERDGMGDDLVPDYLTRVQDGDFFGWPYAYIGDNPQPNFADKRPDLVSRSKIPDVLFRSHSAPLGLVFYDPGVLDVSAFGLFPPDYHGDAFVALHGSWNASTPRGYMVVRVPFKNGRPLGRYEAFVTGFRVNAKVPAQVWGRPAGLAVGIDGGLLIADDSSQRIWRVIYTGE